MKYGHQHPVKQDPMAPAHRLASAVIPFFIGVVAGVGVAGALRATKLSWTWIPFAGLVVPLAWTIDWQLGLGLASTVLSGSLLGYLWHRDAKERGGQEAREEDERIGPLRFAWSRVSAARPAGKRVTEDQLAIGRTRRGGRCQIPFGADRGVHGVVLGATGSGKTVTQAAIAQGYIDEGISTIVVDPKGDRYLRAVLLDAAERCGRRFVEWTPTGKRVYNPFERGGPTEIAEKALAGHRWSEPHYELATQRLLGQVLTTMQAARKWPPRLSQMVDYMDPERLDGLASEVGGEVADRISAYVDGLSARAKADLGGGRDRLAVLCESELGPRLDPHIGHGPILNLLQAIDEGWVVYFHTDADRYPAASKLLGAALVIDLVSLTTLRGELARSLVVIDEFSAVGAEKISRLFGRARDAYMSILLGTQSLADLRGARPDDPSDTLTEQVMSNIEYGIVHRIGDPDSAERIAQMAGTENTWATTRRVNAAGIPEGAGTRTRAREFLIHPDEFKRLPTGEAVVINPMARRAAEIVHISPPKGFA